MEYKLDKKKLRSREEKMILRNGRTLRELGDQYKWNNIHIIGVPEKEKREKGIESVIE